MPTHSPIRVPCNERAARGISLLLASVIALGSLSAAFLVSAADESSGAMKDPYLGDRHAIAEGRDIYRNHCIVCHRNRGGRGPDLFETKLSDAQFAAVVLGGREGFRGKMPAFGKRLSLDQVWKVLAFVRSRNSYQD